MTLCLKAPRAKDSGLLQMGDSHYVRAYGLLDPPLRDALYSALASAADFVDDEKICRRPSNMTCRSREQWELVNMPDCAVEDGKRVKVLSTGFDIIRRGT